MEEKLDATVRRMNAVRGVLTELLGPDLSVELVDTEENRHHALGIVSQLDAYGRSPRWKNAVRRWMDTIEDPENDLRWAVVHGSISMAHVI